MIEAHDDVSSIIVFFSLTKAFLKEKVYAHCIRVFVIARKQIN